MRRKESIVSAITLCVIIAGVIIAWRSGYFSGDRLDSVRGIVARFRELPAAPVLFVAGYILVVLVLLSATAMSVVAGALFGMWGLALAWIGALIGSAIAHYLGRAGGRGLARRFLGHHPLLKQLRNDMSGWDMARLRVLPIAPFGVLSYLAGMSGIPLRLLITATALGALPAMTAYVFAGRQLGAALAGGVSPRTALTTAGVVTGVMVCLAALPTIVKFIARRRSA